MVGVYVIVVSIMTAIVDAVLFQDGATFLLSALGVVLGSALYIRGLL